MFRRDMVEGRVVEREKEKSVGKGRNDLAREEMLREKCYYDVKIFEALLPGPCHRFVKRMGW